MVKSTAGNTTVMLCQLASHPFDPEQTFCVAMTTTHLKVTSFNALNVNPAKI